MSGLSEYGAALRAAVDEVGLAKSSVARTRDSVEEALRQLAAVADGSNNDLLAEATGAIAGTMIGLQDVIDGLQVGTEKITEYLAERGL